MSWSEIVLVARKHNGVKLAAITVAASDGVKRVARRIVIALRPEQIDNLPWLTPGGGVKLLLGHGEHAGKLRLEPGGPAKLVKSTRGATVMIMSPDLATRLRLPPGRLPPEEVGFDFHDTWIEIDLPKWAVPHTASTITGAALHAAIAAAPPVNPAQVTPFRGVAQRTGLGRGVPTKPVPLSGGVLT